MLALGFRCEDVDDTAIRFWADGLLGKLLGPCLIVSSIGNINFILNYRKSSRRP